MCVELIDEVGRGKSIALMTSGKDENSQQFRFKKKHIYMIPVQCFLLMAFKSINKSTGKCSCFVSTKQRV